MRKALLVLLLSLIATPAFAQCETVYIVGQGYQVICYPDPTPQPFACGPLYDNCN